MLCIFCVQSARRVDAQDALNPLYITRTFKYTQTGPETFAREHAKLSLFMVPATNLPSDATVTLTLKDKIFTLRPMVSEELGSPLQGYGYSMESEDFATISDALPVGEYTFSLPLNRSQQTLKSWIDLPAGGEATRIKDFDALQSWNGTPFVVSWATSMILEIAPPTLDFSKPDGTVTLTVPTYSGINSPPPGFLGYRSDSFIISNLTSVPGNLFTGKLVVRALPTGRAPVFTGTASSFPFYARDIYEVRFPLKRPAPAPVIAAQPASLTAVAGTTATLSPSITASGATYVWQKDGTLIPGATNATLTLTSVKPTDAGAYTVTATNSGGSVTSNAATLTVIAPTIAPTISAAPANLTVLAGAKSTLTVIPAGTAPFTYQWFRDGIARPGATSATLTLDLTLPSDAAAYSVRITNSAGSVTSPAATLTVTPVSRISNLSVLTSLASPADSFTLGYVIGGATATGPKPLLLRAAGPALAALGVAGTLDDPQLELFAGSAKTTENDNWGTTASVATALTAAFTSVGAFPFPSPTSKDAATTAHLTARDNSVKISAAPTSTSTPSLPTGAAVAPGLVLAEIYDATPTDTFTIATPRLLNVSVLKSLGTGLTVGFTIAGSTAKTVLIRAIGPTLGEPPFGVPGTVADPQLALFSPASTTPLASNDNWSVPVASAPNVTALTTAFGAVGAFALPPNSRDAALLTTLPPGGYSVQVTGVANTTGTALVEVYEVP